MATRLPQSPLPPPPPPKERQTAVAHRDAPASAVAAARALAAKVVGQVQAAPSFRKLPPATQQALLGDLARIQGALSHSPLAPSPQAAPFESLASLRNRLGGGGGARGPTNDNGATTESPIGEGTGDTRTPASKPAATETIARRAGALSDEIDFPAFVAGLVHGTFDAIVDSAIRQMESFAELVSAVAKNAEDFTRDNVSSNQSRDWLAQQYPKELVLDVHDVESGQPRLRARRTAEDEPAPAPTWLAEFGLEGQELTDELIEEELVPAARRRVGDSRQQMLATMVLLGLNRIVVRDGSISARVRFRAAARDTAKIDYAVSQDPGSGSSWGTRGSSNYVAHDTKISTVGVNVQAESDLKVELFGEVKINFASETLPLDRFVDQARLTLLQRHARPIAGAIAGTGSPGQAAPPLPTSPAPVPPPAPTTPVVTVTPATPPPPAPAPGQPG